MFFVASIVLLNLLISIIGLRQGYIMQNLQIADCK